jgi:MoxR-like ATPase
VHILLVGPPGQAKTMFLKCILETFGEKKAFFTVGGTASKSKVRYTHLKTWVFATSNGTKKLSEPLLSRFRVMYLNEYEFSQFYEISVKKLLADGLDKNQGFVIFVKNGKPGQIHVDQVGSRSATATIVTQPTQ